MVGTKWKSALSEFGDVFMRIMPTPPPFLTARPLSVRALVPRSQATILPAIFLFTYPTSKNGQGPLHVLNIMNLGTPRSAVISAIIFNAIVIPLLIPVALRGVQYRPIGASALLRRNLWIYGLGGLIAPFVGIKLIDLVVHGLFGA